MITSLIAGECGGEKVYGKKWLFLSLMIPEAGSDFEDEIIDFIFLILLQ